MADDEIEPGLRILWLCHCCNGGKGRIEFERNLGQGGAGQGGEERGSITWLMCLFVCSVFLLLFSYLSVHSIVGRRLGLSGPTAPIHIYKDTQYMDPLDWAPLPLHFLLNARSMSSRSPFCVEMNEIICFMMCKKDGRASESLLVPRP
jgi:hypothetical protein